MFHSTGCHGNQKEKDKQLKRSRQILQPRTLKKYNVANKKAVSRWSKISTVKMMNVKRARPRARMNKDSVVWLKNNLNF